MGHIIVRDKSVEFIAAAVDNGLQIRTAVRSGGRPEKKSRC